MNAKKFSDAMSELDSKYINEALTYKKEVKQKEKKSSWIKLGSMAACLCLIVASAVTLSHFLGDHASVTPPISQEIVTPPISQEIAYGFTMEGSDLLYLPISFSQRKTFGLIDENETGLTDENTYQITPDDLGDVMGIVGDSQDESIIGKTVYHFIKFPADDSICIVEVGGTYEFYVKDGVEGMEGTNNPDIIMDAPIEDETGHNDMETSDGAITLEYITELQAKISEAMRNGTLPFVSSSAVYENPYRLQVTVSSNAEDDLAKLKAFDTIGGALQIVYDPGSISVEDAVTE